jgi:beta-glucosidase
MMSGRGFFAAFAEDGGVWGARPYRAGGGIERLGIEPLYFTDGPRGVARGQSTCFPCSMARGASFDVDLERRIGEAMGKEARAQGCTLSGAVCINLLRHPAWGRAQETYGEDPHHLGRMGAALGLGIQAHGVIATVKHFALNSMENARFVIDVSVDERSLHEIYLPHFKHCLDAGIGSVMSAYNKVNGEYCGQNAAAPHRHPAGRVGLHRLHPFGLGDGGSPALWCRGRSRHRESRTHRLRRAIGEGGRGAARSSRE